MRNQLREIGFGEHLPGVLVRGVELPFKGPGLPELFLDPSLHKAWGVKREGAGAWRGRSLPALAR